MTTKQQDSWADDSSSDDESVEQPPQPQSTEDNQNDQQHLEETREQNNEDQQYRQQKPKREYREKRYPDEGERDKYQAPDSEFSIHVSNLSFAAKDEDLVNFFTGGGCNVAEAHVYRDGYKSRGYGVVIFNDEESFKKSFEAHGFTFMDRQMNVKEKVPKSGGYNNNRSQGRGDGRRDGRRDREVNKDRENYKDREGYKRDGQKDVRNRDDRRGRGAGRGDSSQKPSSAETSEVPATRPKVVVADRTLPIEKVGEFVGSNSGIFGAAKARDEHIFEVCEFNSF